MSKIGVVCGSFHKDEVSRMLDTVKATIEDQALLGSWGALMEPVWVPGAFEVPLATKRLLDAGCVGVVTLGIIERGQTLHCLLYTSPSPRDRTRSRMPSSA